MLHLQCQLLFFVACIKRYQTTLQVTLKIISEVFQRKINSTGINTYCYIESVTSMYIFGETKLLNDSSNRSSNHDLC